MKIAIIGFSGCGKSTLARRLGELYNAEVLHLDTVHFLPDWEERKTEDEQKIVEDFLNTHDAWVIDGNYTKLSHERRLKEADQIIMMLFGRFECLRRVTGRYRSFKNKTRPDRADGCSEKLDREFVWWVLYKGRNRGKRDRYRELQKKYKEKTVVIKNQKQLDEFRRSLGLPIEES